MTEPDKLEAMFAALRHSEPYLPDDGFTARVMARLPVPYELPFWLKNGILLGFTAVGSAIAAWSLPVEPLLSFPYTSLVSLPVLGAIGAVLFVFSGALLWLAQTDRL